MQTALALVEKLMPRLANEFQRRLLAATILDHLLAKFRRVRRSYFGHLRLLEHKE